MKQMKYIKLHLCPSLWIIAKYFPHISTNLIRVWLPISGIQQNHMVPSYGKTNILLNWTYNVLNWCLQFRGFLSVCLPYMYRSPGKQECDLDVGYHIDGRQLLHGKSPQLPGSLPSQIRLDAGAAPCHWCLCSLVAKTRMAEWVSQCEIPSFPISWSLFRCGKYSINKYSYHHDRVWDIAVL